MTNEGRAFVAGIMTGISSSFFIASISMGSVEMCGIALALWGGSFLVWRGNLSKEG